ncbi:MAG: Hpt domain-containing protein [Bacteroidales bacterium]|nr:Hpt domain-containing protein [Bacteroidales bacterium]
MTIEEFYAVTSSNYAEALKRMMRPDFVKRFATKFDKDTSFAELAENMESGNVEVAFRAAHTLKGVCKNLAFTKLGDSASEITEVLRAGDLAKAKEMFPTVKEQYEEIISTLALVE